MIYLAITSKSFVLSKKLTHPLKQHEDLGQSPAYLHDTTQGEPSTEEVSTGMEGQVKVLGEAEMKGIGMKLIE